MRKVNEVKKSTKDKELHSGLITKWGNEFKTAGDMLKDEGDEERGESEGEEEEDMEDKKDVKNVFLGFQTAKSLLNSCKTEFKPASSSSTPRLPSLHMSNHVKTEPGLTHRSPPVVKKEVPNITYFFEKKDEDSVPAPEAAVKKEPAPEVVLKKEPAPEVVLKKEPAPEVVLKKEPAPEVVLKKEKDCDTKVFSKPKPQIKYFFEKDSPEKIVEETKGKSNSDNLSDYSGPSSPEMFVDLTESPKRLVQFMYL